MDKVIIRFKDNSYTNTKFHVLIPDVQIAQYHSYHWYQVGIYDKITHDYSFTLAARYHRNSAYWVSSFTANANLYAAITGKAGSYKQNMSVFVNNPTIVTGDYSWIFMCTQWSLF